MQIEISQEDDVRIIALTGRFTVGEGDAFKSELSPVKDNSSKIIFDCTNMEYIDSTGLGLVVRFFKEFSAQGGKFALAGLQAKPKMVFEITRAYKIFDIFESVSAAREALK